VFFILLFLIGRTVASEPARPASIDGFVTGTGATVLGGVAIGVNELNEGRYQQAVSDHAGYYRVDHLTSGAYSIWAEAKGYGCIVYPNLALFPQGSIFTRTSILKAQERAPRLVKLSAATISN
jgi:hypothetical protein